MAIVATFISPEGKTMFYVEDFKGRIISLPYNAKQMVFERAKALQQTTIPHMNGITQDEISWAYEIAYS